MSLLNRNRYRKKLQELLSTADDEPFFQMVWAIDALQSGRAGAAAHCIRFPQEAATSDISSRFAIYKWDLETLIGQLLITPKSKRRNGSIRLLNCTRFAAGAAAVNHLRKLEDAEARIYLDHFNALSEMHRIAQRQFPWQRGYFDVVQLYRYAYIYGQGECADYFKRACGLTINDFSLIGFALYAAFQGRPWLKRRFSLEQLGIAPSTIEAVLMLLSKPIAQARDEMILLIREANEKNGRPLPTAYQPSLLRRFPIVSFSDCNERLRAPLPALILLRITSGVYYDVIGGGAHLRNEASDRFERYSAEYISAMMPRFKVTRSHKYTFRRNSIDTPDILIRDGGQVIMAVE